MDRELIAMSTIQRTLCELDADERERVLTWVISKAQTVYVVEEAAIVEASELAHAVVPPAPVAVPATAVDASTIRAVAVETPAVVEAIVEAVVEEAPAAEAPQGSEAQEEAAESPAQNA